MNLNACLLVLALGFTSCQATTPEKIIVEFPVHAETRSEFISELNEILVDTRAYDGCLDVTVWTNEEEDDKVWLYEEWATRSHQEAYLKWRTDTGNTSHLGPFINGGLRFLWLEEH